MLNRIEVQVFSRIKANFSEKIKKRYPNLDFTTTDRSPTKPKFPTVYIHLLESPEAGGTLDGLEICGVNATFQVDVSDNQSPDRADEISNEVMRIMKKMRFKVRTMPFHNNTADVYRTTSRYRRIIGDGDLL